MKGDVVEFRHSEAFDPTAGPSIVSRMRLFLTQSFAAGNWSDGDSVNVPVLTVNIHDRDIATISYKSGPES